MMKWVSRSVFYSSSLFTVIEFIYYKIFLLRKRNPNKGGEFFKKGVG